ncbi:MAG: 6-phosphogluconolactonase, partial [Rubrobacteraceae bacterium]
GFNEPGASFDSRTRVVRLAETTRLVNASDFAGDRAPEQAITVGMRTIFESREVLMLASGANKARAVEAAVEGGITDRVPASMLKQHENTTFLVDRDAATIV